MYARYHRLTLLGYCLILLQLRCCAAEITFPTTVEVDLVFPRNDTYAPSAIFPVVLAVHNAHAAVALDPHIRWYIDRITPPRNTTTSPGGAPIHLTAANLSSSDLYLTFGGLYGHLNMEGTWALNWAVITTDCDASGPPSEVVHHSSRFRIDGGTVFFSTKSGAQQPDLAAPVAEGTCADMQGVTYQVAGLDGPASSSCAVHSPTPSAAADPCRVKLDASTASSISASLTATACAFPHPVVNCPGSPSESAPGAPQSTTGTSRGQRFAAGGAALFKLAAAWVAVCYFLV